jgi:excisionase family DNA binding protein
MSKKESSSAVVPNPQYFNVEQAACYLGCTVSAVRHQLVYARAVPFVFLGKRIIFSKNDLDSFMARKRAEAA